jgi:hypothetical protein
MGVTTGSFRATTKSPEGDGFSGGFDDPPVISRGHERATDLRTVLQSMDKFSIAVL